MRRTVEITGMTCAACEATVGDALRDLPGVTSAKASALKHHVVLTGDDLPSNAHIRKALAGTPYGIGREPWFTRDRRAWRDVAGIALVVTVVAIAATTVWSGPSFQALTAKASSGSLLVIATLGVIASVSTCAVVVGAVAAGLGSSLPATAPPRARWGVQLAFNGGRVVGFAVLGAVIGAIGTALALSGAAITVATLASALVIAIVGVRLTGLSPRTSGWQVSLPSSWSRWATRTPPVGPAAARQGAARAAALGAATFILPCGFTQAVQLYAISTASPARAAIIMAVFALGTTPGLLAIGMATAMRASGLAARAVGVVAIGFAAVIVTGALDIGSESNAPDAPVAASANVTFVDGRQHVATSFDERGYSPADTVVYAGEPITWTFTPEGLSCAGILDLGQFGLDPVNALWEPQTVEFTPLHPGAYEYECTMGMYKGTITVIDRPQGA